MQKILTSFPGIPPDYRNTRKQEMENRDIAGNSMLIMHVTYLILHLIQKRMDFLSKVYVYLIRIYTVFVLKNGNLKL